MKIIYQKNQIKAVDNKAAQYLQISSFQLMQRAGAAIYTHVKKYQDVLVVAGAGNNAGDGFIIAKLARSNGQKVTVWSLIAIDDLPDDAQMAAKQYLHAGGDIIHQQPLMSFEVIIDAIFGTGLSRDIDGMYADAVNWINSQSATIIAVDIPSGLDADTGMVKGVAISADITVTIICYKAGLVTNNGKDMCGKLWLEDLAIPAEVFQQIPSQLYLLDKSVLAHSLFKRQHNSHKGSFGLLAIAGGHDGMLGALILAGRAALRSGCGVVEVISNCKQTVMISIQCPELITANDIHAARLLKSADVIAVGPGLGLNQQSKEVLQYCIAQNKPMVIDADGLTIIAAGPQFEHNVVLTPHPKEAATLLNTDVASIQANRITAAKKISTTYGACVILKGSGTVIADTTGNVYICPFGYSGMATAGMGDVLTGMVAGLMAQGFAPIDAACTAVVWHAVAAESCNKGNSLIASDVVEQLASTIQ
ncbi:NAD(P)H-hydrate epimerase / ADP-dependent (S)-NAD(P)H-hydrate dehydratase [hydrothermal vent metagenome]|uniref:Nicotinamide nucleotide repair protein n=1 Tax=hydrothermal vent metagenome TaxID=652676 RepID=A0A3B0VL44_9ZZZZ